MADWYTAEIAAPGSLPFRVAKYVRVVERKLFENHVEGFRTCVHGFTHWARLPFYLKP